MPPLPQSYAKQNDERKRVTSSQNADVFGQIKAAGGDQPVNVVNDSSAKGGEKPLPAITAANGSPAKMAVDDLTSVQASPPPTVKRSMHSRQPAGDVFDHDNGLTLPQTTPQRAVASFSEDVNGMFLGIGETHLANELGLPPDSLRIKSRPLPERSSTLETTRRFPLDLAPRLSIDREKPVASRTTSLPGKVTSGQSYLAPLALTRTPSSPNLSARPITPTSNTSSPSSIHRQKKEAQSSDFGPAIAVTEDTVKARTREISGSTITGPSYNASSVRLVASPRPASVHSFRSPTNPSHEWLASPGSVAQTEETLERIVTPGGDEDDEEKGRRVACELLEDDYSTIAYDRMAMFLGGP